VETRAVAKYVRISPHKVRLVTNILVGKKVAEALGILKFTPKRAAKVVEKTIKSAVANAEQHPDVDVDNLYVKQIYVMRIQGLYLSAFVPVLLVGLIGLEKGPVTLLLY